MTAFLVAAALLTAGALVCVLPPLLRRRTPGARVARGELNLALLRDQLAELDADLASGALSTEQYAQARAEIERRVLEETQSEDSAGQGPGGTAQTAAVVIAALVPMAAALLYLQIGAPGAITERAATPAHPEMSAADIEGMIGRLEARLRDNPEDASGWMLLARSNVALQRYPEAVKAYARATELVKDDAGLYADYADTLAMAQGRRLEGEAERLIEKALEIDPDHLKALALAGTIAFNRKDYDGAIRRWERILALAPPDSPYLDPVRESVAEARSRAGGAAGAPVTGAPAATAPGGVSQPPAAAERQAAAPASSVSGTVRLAPQLAGRVEPSDTVFIFARALSGPRMPLAALRKQVRDLPAEFNLDDSMAMTPNARLSDHPKIVIVARISKGGGPVAQPGDLEGASPPAQVGDRGIAVVIDSEVR